VHFTSATHRPSDDWFHLPPGIEKRLRLTHRNSGIPVQGLAGGRLGALNSSASVWIKLDATATDSSS
jgi:beta-mannosidase